MNTQSIGIAAVGTYTPETYITAAEIANQTGIPEEVIITKFGLVRKPVPGPDDHTNAMALWAAHDALAQTNIVPNDIDIVLCTTEEWKEYPLWTAGIKLAHDLGAHRAWAIDVQMRCGTTMAAIKMARALMLAEPDVNTVLIAGGYRNGDLVDYTNPRSRFLINLSAGGGALVLQKNYPHNQVLGSSVIVDGSFSLDVIVPAGGTVEPLSYDALAAHRNCLDVPNPDGMKQRLDELSMRQFLKVIDQALAQSGHTRRNINYVNLLHMKRSAHDFVLRELGLREDQSYYLNEFGHMGQQDQTMSIKKGLATGRLKDGDLMVMVAAGIGYAWAASVVQWGPNTTNL
ncbi:MAG: 3-oxoacyl-ACP synthase [Chloroflexi bacterium AL-W]|nr:3-oxoacyl-ACP synthase [Chloroflexi bacterium AL-N1]NOK67860.1 3-oxoacyl-ACP synthase [Chloroflexi bacterium AL-N10]NOK75370.1 3-oxoacyl-ACP synthase [Chloroflexi bacterium AL-N5]NOK82158.1 3-oxoacyl-ACP synthase [Chloroflexi bacterium AL-W]NOK90003.1 3-oxoacyl-ACP synthase [Chloroflexi bacterium AL-N15]